MGRTSCCVARLHTNPEYGCELRLYIFINGYIIILCYPYSQQLGSSPRWNLLLLGLVWSCINDCVLVSVPALEVSTLNKNQKVFVFYPTHLPKVTVARLENKWLKHVQFSIVVYWKRTNCMINLCPLFYISLFWKFNSLLVRDAVSDNCWTWLFKCVFRLQLSCVCVLLDMVGYLCVVHVL